VIGLTVHEPVPALKQPATNPIKSMNNVNNITPLSELVKGWSRMDGLGRGHPILTKTLAEMTTPNSITNDQLKSKHARKEELTS
jgi:hypothetical protein